MEKRGLIQTFRYFLSGSEGKDQAEYYETLSTVFPLARFDIVIFNRHKYDVMLSFLKPPPQVQAPILEIGCGYGHFTRELGALGYKVIGMDIAPSLIKGAEQPTKSKNVAYLVGDISEMGTGGELDQKLTHHPFQQGLQGKFSYIIAADVLEHIPLDPVETARKLRGYVDVSGALIAALPSKWVLNRPGHIWRYLPEKWGPLFEQAGFRVAAQKMSKISLWKLPTPVDMSLVYALEPSS